jgi:hypothetical protein
MFKIEYICVGLIVLLCLVFIIRKLKNPSDFSCPGCSGCDDPESCDSNKKQDKDKP